MDTKEHFIFLETIEGLIKTDKNSDLKVYEAYGKYIENTGTYDYYEPKCCECNKDEIRYICRNKYELILKIYTNEDKFRKALLKSYNKIVNTIDDSVWCIMKKVIDIYLDTPDLLKWSVCDHFTYY